MNAPRSLFSLPKIAARPMSPMLSHTLLPVPVDTPPSRFLARAACAALVQRILALANAAALQINVVGYSEGNLRWGRNYPSTAGDVSNTSLSMADFDPWGLVSHQLETNRIDGADLQSAVAELRELAGYASTREGMFYPPLSLQQPYLDPPLWSEASFELDAAARAEAARPLARASEVAGLSSAGYLAVGASGFGTFNPRNLLRYHPYTTAQYSITVRTPDGSGSGWAGVSDHDWARIDTAELSRRALEKCKASANPSALEPGRYTLIMEPQAVADMVSLIVSSLSRRDAEAGVSVFSDGSTPTRTKLGQKVLDERITLSADPMDPEGGFIPFNRYGEPYRKVTWIDRGVLTNLSYNSYYAYYAKHPADDTPRGGVDPDTIVEEGLSNSGAIRMSGGDASIEEMIATTKRGLLVTRFNRPEVLAVSLLATGTTRDGLWLIENGKIVKPVKNFRFTESPMFIFNRLEQLGTPVRVFSPAERGNPPRAIVVPPAKVRDFNFTSLSDAV